MSPEKLLGCGVWIFRQMRDLLAQSLQGQLEQFMLPVIGVGENWVPALGLRVRRGVLRMFMFKYHGDGAWLQSGRRYAIQAFLAPESCRGSFCVSEHDFQPLEKTIAEQGNLCPACHRSLSWNKLVDEWGW